MNDNFDPLERDKAPKTPEEWRYIWDAVIFAQRGRRLLTARTLGIASIIVAAWNAPTLREAILLLIGGMGR